MPKRMEGQRTLSDYQLSQVDVRLVLKEGAPLYSTQAMDGPRQAVEVMREAMKDLDREMVCVVNMDNKLRPLNYHVVSIGGIGESLVPIQNVFKSGILSNAANIMMLHNHPSGVVTPSREDMIITKRLTEAGKLMNIPVMDHIIIGGGEGRIYSFREHDPHMFDPGIDMSYIESLTGGVREDETLYKGGSTIMMNRKEFFEEMKNKIKEFLPKEYANASAELTEVTKNNDQVLTALTIKKEDQSVVPAIYLDEKFAQYQDGKSFDDCAKEVADLRMQHEETMLSFDVRDVLNYEAVKDNLQIRICDPEMNQERMNNLAFTEHGDFIATYAVAVGTVRDEGEGSIPVTRDMQKIWQVSCDEIHQDALAAEKARGAQLSSLEDLMTSMMWGGEPENLLESEQSAADFSMPTFCLTNETKLGGASLILQDDVMKQIGDFMGENFYVLPSSVHEVLMMPESQAPDLRELTNMVREVNETQVEPQDQLSDKVQYYDRESGVLENAEHRQERLEAAKSAKESTRSDRSAEKKSIHGRLAEKKSEHEKMQQEKDTVKNVHKANDVSL